MADGPEGWLSFPVCHVQGYTFALWSDRGVLSNSVICQQDQCLIYSDNASFICFCGKRGWAAFHKFSKLTTSSFPVSTALRGLGMALSSPQGPVERGVGKEPARDPKDLGL